MLMILGSVVMDVWPFNPTETGRDSGGDYVEKAVMGRRPPLEFVGEASETFSVRARLFPEKLGGLNSLAQLSAMRKSGSPQYFMRGDGVPFGWVVVESVNESSTYLDAKGVGRVIDVDIQLKRADAPTASGFFASIAGLIGQ